MHMHRYYHTHIYIYIHTYAIIHAHTYIYIYIHTYAIIHTHTYIHTHIRDHSHTHTHIYIYINSIYMSNRFLLLKMRPQPHLGHLGPLHSSWLQGTWVCTHRSSAGLLEVRDLMGSESLGRPISYSPQARLGASEAPMPGHPRCCRTSNYWILEWPRNGMSSTNIHKPYPTISNHLSCLVPARATHLSCLVWLVWSLMSDLPGCFPVKL